VFCQAKAPGKSLSLFPLMDYRRNVELSLASDEVVFFSVCKPLAEESGLDCPSEAAICSAKKDHKSGWKVINSGTRGLLLLCTIFFKLAPV
jgi:hypothetical protein